MISLDSSIMEECEKEGEKEGEEADVVCNYIRGVNKNSKVKSSFSSYTENAS